MIDISATLEIHNNTVSELSAGSHKLVVAVCDGCGKIRHLQFRQYRDTCKQCMPKLPDVRAKKSRSMKGQNTAPRTEETKLKISKSTSGEKNHNYGKPKSPETLQKITEAANNRPPMTDAHREAIRQGNNGVKRSDETKANQSKSWTEERRRESSMTRQQCDNITDWNGFSRDQRYCHKFNEPLRNMIREKYGNCCFLCGTPANKNIGRDGNQRKLAVHHIDMDKESGCNGNGLQLIPLCMTCHPPAHTPLWTARIQYLLANVW